MKRGEKALVQIYHEFITNDDVYLKELLMKNEAYDGERDLWVEIEIKKIVKVEDWYNDGTAVCRTLRKGKGRSPYSDSVVLFRLKIEVNGTQIYSNYSANSQVPVEEQEDYRNLNHD